MAPDHKRQVERTPSTSRHHDLVVFVALWLPYAWLVRRFWFLCDDAYISFRYARNWAAGEGLRFNLGEHVPVEGYSNFLWVSLCSLIELCGGSPVTLINWVSFGMGSALLYGVFRALRNRFDVALLPACLATLSVGCFPPFAVWSTGGLETMAFAALTFLTFERLLMRREAMAPIAGALAGLGMSMLRVEGIAWALGIGVMAVVVRRRAGERAARPGVRFMGLLILSYGIYWICRFQYFQSPLPNTVYAKSSMNLSTLSRGLRYVASFVLAFLSPLALLLSARSALGGRRPIVGAPLILMILGVHVFAVLVGGDFMTMGRFLLPAVAFQGLLLGWFLDGLGRRVRWLPLPVGAALVIVGLTPAWNIHLAPESLRVAVQFRHNTSVYRSELDQWRFMCEGTRVNKVSGLALRWHGSPDQTLVRGAVGAAGFYSEMFILDRYGLVNREVARRNVTRVNQSAGHDKAVRPSYFLDQRPDYMYGYAFDASLLPGAIQSRVRRWKAEESDLYVPELIELPAAPEWGDDTYLVIYRLRAGDESAEVAWRAFETGVGKIVDSPR